MCENGVAISLKITGGDMHERAGKHVEELLQMPSNNHSIFLYYPLDGT